MTKRTWGDDIFAGFSPKPAPPDEWKDATHMTNANALPIQERLRANIAPSLQDCREAADHIDALEKALRDYVNKYDDMDLALKHMRAIAAAFGR